MAEHNKGNDAPKRVIPPWFLFLVVLLLGFALFGDRGLIQVYKAYLQKTELEEKIVALEKTNEELRQEIEALRTDLKAIESIARQELGMVRPDEQVYQFHTRPPVPSTELPPSENSEEPAK